jgi:hypothetical protein
VQVERDSAFETLDDRALRSAVALAGRGEVLQGVCHFTEVPRALLELGHVL